MEPKRSLPCSQDPATGPCPKTNRAHNLPPYFPKVHSNIRPSSSEWFFLSGFLTKILYVFLISAMDATYHVKLILLDLIIIIILGKVYKLWSSSLRSLLKEMLPVLVFILCAFKIRSFWEVSDNGKLQYLLTLVTTDVPPNKWNE
jgi:hypothetical protein